MQFWSNTTNQINRYCGSVFVGHCHSEQLLEHFDEFAEELNWDPAFLLHIGMDGPNVNLKFQNDLMNHFQETSGNLFLTLTLAHSTKSILLSRKVFRNYQLILISLQWTFMGFLSCLVLDGKIIPNSRT